LHFLAKQPVVVKIDMRRVGLDGLEVFWAELSSAVRRYASSAITISSVWAVDPEAAPEDVLLTWQQLLALHRQWHSLAKELKEAEAALGEDSTEANFGWLTDVKSRLSEIDGTEALVEGFGAPSGRTARTF
jgi:DNA primase